MSVAIIQFKDEAQKLSYLEAKRAKETRRDETLNAASARKFRENHGIPMIDWQPMSDAPKDGTWILGINNRGNCAVIIWSASASAGEGRGFYPGWIHPFTQGELSTFWNGANGSVPVAWAALPNGEEAKAIIERYAKH